MPAWLRGLSFRAFSVSRRYGRVISRVRRLSFVRIISKCNFYIFEPLPVAASTRTAFLFSNPLLDPHPL